MDQSELRKVLRRVETELEEQKRGVYLHYAEIKLKIPSDVKTLTIDQMREAGAVISPDLTLPRKAANYVKKHAESTRKKESLLDKLNEIHEQHKSQIVSYYKQAKRELPKELLKKNLCDLDDADWNRIGVRGDV